MPIVVNRLFTIILASCLLLDIPARADDSVTDASDPDAKLATYSETISILAVPGNKKAVIFSPVDDKAYLAVSAGGRIAYTYLPSAVVDATVSRIAKFDGVDLDIRDYPFDSDIPAGTQIAADYQPPLSFMKIIKTSAINIAIVIIVFALALMAMMTFEQAKPMLDEKFRMAKRAFVRPKANHDTVTFKDVAGMEAEKQELLEIVDYLKNPGKYEAFGAHVPAGVLMEGLPGNGKTFLARAVAGETGRPFFYVSAAEFENMLVGLGAAKIRRLFKAARKKAPCIIFIDEIDAIGMSRDNAHHAWEVQTLNQLLNEMAGFERNKGIVVIGATNKAEVLDPALTRPGRLTRKIHVSAPDRETRFSILSLHASKVKLAPDADLSVIAAGTPGFSAADLENIVNEACILAIRNDKDTIGMIDLDHAKDKVMMGGTCSNTALDEEEARITAYHEAGHAICSVMQEECDPIYKATILPRAGSLGMVVNLPEKDSHTIRLSKLKANLTVLMGGRMAEIEIFGANGVTTGAAADLKEAKRIAWAMVTQWGMGSNICAGMSMEQIGGGKANQADPVAIEEIRLKIDEACSAASEIIRTNRVAFEAIAKALLDNGLLSGEQIRDIVDASSVSIAA